ncbi:TonB-dependent receptor [Novosphingobium aerophilum]|nr:TonB-dependent receptor [Novosphingobium aerophilum]
MKKLAFGVSASIFALTCTPAFAQAADAEQAENSDEATQAADSADAGEIIVTANRDPSRLSKTPIALSAISGADLAASGVTTPTALAAITPNLSITRDAVPASGGGLQITIRGITSTDASEKGDPSAAFLRDGIYIARPQAQEVSFFDVERVEVLRGPQGTLYGRNTTAGVVNVLSVRPKDKFEVVGDFGYGSYNNITGTGVVNVPVSEGLALRAAVNHEQRDSTVIPTNSTVDINPFSNNTSVRLSALAKPTDNVTLFVQGDYSWIKGSGFAVVPVTNFFQVPFTALTAPVRIEADADVLRSTNRVIPWEEYRDNRDRGVMSELNVDLGFGNVTWLSSYRELDRDEHRHQGPGGTTKSVFVGNFWQHSQELRLSLGGNSWWKAQLGGYYFKEQSNLIGANMTANTGFIQGPTKAIGKALFAQATVTPLDGFNITAGVRYSHDDKSRKGVIANDPFGTPVTTSINDAARSFSKTTWRIGADYDLPGLGLVYATVSTGYKAGGFNDGCEIGTQAGCSLTAAQLYYQPESVTSYEAGFKWRLLDNIVRLNGAAFHYDYANMQLSQASTCSGIACQVTSNAGQSKIDGVELESVLQPAKGHVFNLSANWLNARFTEFAPAAGVNLAGRPLSRAPKWTLSAGYTFTQELENGGKITANVTSRYSAQYDLTDLATRVFFYQPSFTKTDVSLGYTAPNGVWNVQVFGRNLENTLALTYARNSATGEATFEQPRNFGVRAGFRF